MNTKIIVKYLKCFGVFLLWILYALGTQKARLRYYVGKNKGMNCVKYDTDFLGADATFHPWEKPTKEYYTFKEFFRLFIK